MPFDRLPLPSSRSRWTSAAVNRTSTRMRFCSSERGGLPAPSLLPPLVPLDGGIDLIRSSDELHSEVASSVENL